MEEKEEDKGEEVKSGVQKDLVEKMQRKNRKLPYGEEDRRRKKRKAGRVTTVPERDKSW